MMRAAACVLAASAAAACAAPQNPGLGSRPALSEQIPPMELGLRLLRSDEPTMALSAFNRALVDGGATAEALTGVAVALHRLNRRKEAIRFLKSAIDADPNFAIARNNLGVMLYEQGDLSNAVTELEVAYALTGGSDRAVATNLGIAETIAAQETPPAPEADVAFDVIRFGHGVYRLEPRAPQTAEDPT